MRFSLQDMVRNTLAEAEMREKTAQAEGGFPEGKKPLPKKEEKAEAAEEAAEGEQNGAPGRNEESYEEKTSSVFVEKLASAVQFCNDSFIKEAVGKLEEPPATRPATTTVGSGIGATAVPSTIDDVTGGLQSENTGQSTKNQIPTAPGKDVASPGQTNPDTALETDINAPPGGSEDWTNKDKMKQAQVQRVLGVMSKMGEDALNPAKIAAGAGPLENPNASKSEEGVPSQPGEVSKQKAMILSNAAAISATKQQAKAVPKARMGEVLSEPAQKKSTDPVLHENLDAASGAGVKLSSVEKAAAARSLLQKIAEEGAKEDASSEEKERASKLQEVLKAKQKEKEACSTKQGSAMPLSGGY